MYTLIQEYLGILATRCASCQRMTHIDKNDILRQYNDKIIMCSDRACGIILLSVTASWRQYQNKPRPSDLSPLSPPKDYWIHSFWSQNTEKRNAAISQMRLRSVFKMRVSILNTATTEQIGYGSISFFVCFLLMNQIVNHHLEKALKYYILGRDEFRNI